MKRFFFCLATSIVTRALSSGIIPFLAFYLTAEQLGVYSLATTGLSLMAVIIVGGMRQLFIPRYLHTPHEEKASFMMHFMSLSLFFAGVSSCLLILLWALANTCNIPVPSLTLVVIVLIAAFLFFVQDIVLQWCALVDRIFLLITVQIFSALVTGVISAWALLYPHDKVFWLMSAQAMGYGIAIFVIIFYGSLTLEKITIASLMRFSRAVLAESIASIPFIVRPFLLSAVNRGMLGVLHGMQAVGFYAPIDVISALFQFGIMQPLNQAYFPQVMHKMSQDMATEYHKHERIMWIVLSTLLLLIGFSYPVVGIIIDYLPPIYQHIKPFVIPVLLMQCFLMAATFISCVLQLYHKTAVMSWLFFKGVITHILSGSMLYYFVGDVGILYGACVGSVVFFLGLYRYSYKHILGNNYEQNFFRRLV